MALLLLLLCALAGVAQAAPAAGLRLQSLKLSSGYEFQAQSPPGHLEPLPLVLMLSGYCLPASNQDDMQLRYSELVHQMRFIYVPLKSQRVTRTCAICPTTIRAAEAAGDMPFYAASARLLQPVTAMGACTAWDATSACCVPSSDGRDGGDVPMLREVISRTKEHFPVDASRIYVVGIANGGFMALRLACEMGSELAGVVAYASGLYASQCALKTGVPMLLMQGNADVVVPFAGGYNSAGVSFPGFRESKTIWSSINGCSASPAQSNWTARAGNNAPLNIAVSTYGDCTRDPLVAWEIDKGQHFALPDTSAVIFQKALRTFLWPLRAKASSV